MARPSSRPGPNRLIAVTVAFAGVFGIVAAVPGAPAAAEVLPGFSQDAVLDGLDRPTGMEFAADGTVFITEKRGRVLRFDGIDDQTPTVVADRRAQTHNSGDRGMLGLAVHPDYPAVPWVYVSYTLDQHPDGGPIPAYGQPGGNSDPCPDSGTTGCPALSRVVRFNGTIANAPERVLFEGHCQQFNNHTVGDLEFESDGSLLVSFGDGSTGSFVEYGQRQNLCGDPPGPVGTNLDRPTTEGGQARSQDILTRSDPTGVHGSVLRVDAGTFDARPNNPLADDPEANAARIIATGLRNPFRMEVDPQSGRIYVGNVGGAGAEEINVVESSASEIFNSGWPCYEGPGTTRNTFWLTVNICQQLIASGDHDAPMFSYGRNEAVVAGEPCPNGGLAVSGLALNRSGFGPEAMSGALFFSDYTRDCIWYLPAGGDGFPNAGGATLFASDVGAIVDLEFGPDGNLYAVDIAQDRVLRFTETGGNQAPSARFTATPSVGAPPLQVDFDGTASSDPNPDDSLSYGWDFDGNGSIDASGPTASHTYTQPGEYAARLRVTDGGGLTGTTVRTIAVGDGTLDVDVAQPATGRTFRAGAIVPAQATATDAAGALVPSSSFSWDFDLIHCVPNAPDSCHRHDHATIEGARGTFVMPDHEYPSYIEATLTIDPPNAAPSVATFDIDYRVVDVDVRTQPAGLEVLIGSAAESAPFTRPVAMSATTNASVTSTQVVGGTTYSFVEWQLDGERLSTDRFVEFNTDADAVLLAVYRSDGGDDTERPSTPRGLRSDEVASGVRLTWTASTDDVGVVDYVIYRSTSGGVGSEFARSSGAAWIDADVVAGVTYTYTVRAQDAAGNLSWRSNLSSELVEAGAPDTERPSTPRGLRSDEVASGIRLSWTASTDNVGVSDYVIFRSTSGGVGPEVARTSETAWIDTDVVAGETYTYTIRAEDAAGNLSWRSNLNTERYR